MNNLEPKKLALLRMLQIYEEYTDCDHTLTQEEISKKLENEYGISID
ncbi:MAG TPA: WYL domain-containing protein, partial [Eubacterium sp.]|nr:WYL domain-containing protein [Eubacterium sp.]